MPPGGLLATRPIVGRLMADRRLAVAVECFPDTDVLLIHWFNNQEETHVTLFVWLVAYILQVEMFHPIGEINERYRGEYGSADIDQVLFKRFWQRNQRYQTICLPCIQKRKQKESKTERRKVCA